MNDSWRQSSKRTNSTYFDKSKRKRVDQQLWRGLALTHVHSKLPFFFFNLETQLFVFCT